jgi:hypothetical protein
VETFCDRLMDQLAEGGTDDVAMIAVRIPDTTPRSYTATAE